MNDPVPHAIVVGCGRVGAGLARRLTEEHHTVAVIDVAPAAFRRLGDLDVDRVEGVGFDRATLERAGVERAATLAAVTNGDNTNIVVARTGREMFGVPRVFARIYDTRRAAIYERLGIPTVATAALTIEMAMRRALPDDGTVRWIDASARVCLVERAVPPELVGRRYGDIEEQVGVRVLAVRRLGVAVLMSADLVAQEGDVVYAGVEGDLVDGLEARLAGAAGGGGHR